MRKIKKGDQVVLIAGRDKGRVGVILSVIQSGFKVTVEGANLVKRHTKGNPSLQKPGGIIEKEAPVNISNVAIFNKATGKADRVGFKVLEDGRKVRFFKSTGEVIDLKETVG